MSRVLAFTLMVCVSGSSMAFAGESLAQSGSRIVQRVAQVQALADTATSRVATPIAASQAAMFVTRSGAGPSKALLGQASPALANSGMRKRTKAIIYIAAGIGFAATAYAIDHKVLDVTPSSLGTRKD
jgi:hypothetical protein